MSFTVICICITLAIIPNTSMYTDLASVYSWWYRWVTNWRNRLNKMRGETWQMLLHGSWEVTEGFDDMTVMWILYAMAFRVTRSRPNSTPWKILDWHVRQPSPPPPPPSWMVSVPPVLFRILTKKHWSCGQTPHWGTLICHRSFGGNPTHDIFTISQIE